MAESEMSSWRKWHFPRTESKYWIGPYVEAFGVEADIPSRGNSLSKGLEG